MLQCYFYDLFLSFIFYFFTGAFFYSLNYCVHFLFDFLLFLLVFFSSVMILFFLGGILYTSDFFDIHSPRNIFVLCDYKTVLSVLGLYE